MRTYETIWDPLKRLPHKDATQIGVSITAPRALHKRIIKAVIKEKYIDVGYKLQLLDDYGGKKAVLGFERKGTVLRFYLTFTIGAADV